MALAIRTGVPPHVWYNDTRAAVTAIKILEMIDRESRKRK